MLWEIIGRQVALTPLSDSVVQLALDDGWRCPRLFQSGELVWL